MHPIADLELENNPYGSPLAAESVATADLQTDVPVDELRAFVGPNADHYLRKWAPRLLDPEGDVGVSWIALFFPTCWLAYRKMFMLGMAIWAVDFGITVVSAITFPLSSGRYVAMALTMRLVLVVVCCVSANAWYLKHALRSIESARSEGYEGEHLWHALAHRGGTSIGLLIGIIFLTGFLSLIGRVVLIGLT